MLTVARPLEQRMGAGGRMYGMSKTTLGFLFLFAFGLFAFAALMCASAAGQSANYRVIHNFSGYPNHTAHTIGPVIFDKAGNMYGVGITGGAYDDGAAYELSPDGHGNWTETILYDFCQNFDGLSCVDGDSSLQFLQRLRERYVSRRRPGREEPDGFGSSGQSVWNYGRRRWRVRQL